MQAITHRELAGGSRQTKLKKRDKVQIFLYGSDETKEFILSVLDKTTSTRLLEITRIYFDSISKVHCNSA